MNTLVRSWYLVLVPLLAIACREIVTVPPGIPVEGYELRGTVTSQNGIPLDSVTVRLLYSFRYLGSNRIDSTDIIIRDSTRIVFVAAFTPEGVYIHELFFGFRSPGILPRFLWNGLDDHLQPVPSGKYVIRYSYDTLVVKEVPVVISGHESATTNASGVFTLQGNSFPIGEAFDIYDDDGSFLGVYQITNEVEVVLVRGSTVSRYYVTMNPNSITRGFFTVP